MVFLGANFQDCFACLKSFQKILLEDDEVLSVWFSNSFIWWSAYINNSYIISPVFRFTVLLFLVTSVVSLSVSAASQFYADVIVSDVTSIYDADTFKVNIKHWPDVIGKHISIRVLGVDAPEIRGKCASEKAAARKAKQFTVQFLRAGQVVELRSIKRGKYFRLLAAVYVDGNNLADALVKAKLARPYDGGRRLGWCG